MHDVLVKVLSKSDFSESPGSWRGIHRVSMVFFTGFSWVHILGSYGGSMGIEWAFHGFDGIQSGLVEYHINDDLIWS